MLEDCYICFQSTAVHRYQPLPMPMCSHPFPVPCGLPWLARHNSCPQCRAVIVKTPVSVSTLVTADANVAVSAWFFQELHRINLNKGLAIVTGRGLLFHSLQPDSGPRWRMFAPTALPEAHKTVVLLKCRHWIPKSTLWVAVYTNDTADAAALARQLVTCSDLAPSRRAAWS